MMKLQSMYIILLHVEKYFSNAYIIKTCTTLDINYVTISAAFHTTSRIGGSFYIYIIHKPIDFSIDFSYDLRLLVGLLPTNKKNNLCHMVIGLKQVRVPIGT